MRLRLLDVETTGIPSETEKHALVEIGTCDLVQSPSGWRIEAPVATLVNPGRPIPIEAMAIHHIRDSDVVGAPSPDRVLMTLRDGATHFCAHNIDFERKFYAGGDTPWICTFKSALRIWPEAPSHSNQVLRYFLDVDAHEDFDPALAMPPPSRRPRCVRLRFHPARADRPSADRGPRSLVIGPCAARQGRLRQAPRQALVGSPDRLPPMAHQIRHG